MRKKNGFTSIELLVSFIIVSAIAIGLFDVILNYRNQEQIAAYEATIQSYINTLTKTIQDDLIKRKLASVTISGNQVNFTFEEKDGTSETARLIVLKDDENEQSIRYGIKDEEINYPIPNIADLTIDRYKFQTIGNVGAQFLSIEIILKHPNFDTDKRILITSPIQYTK